MARPIDSDKLIKDLELSIKSWSADCNSNAGIMLLAYQDILHRVKNMPTADVAPKSEVVKEVIEFIENEIKAMEDHTPTDELDKAIGLVTWILLGVVDQLKRKYTEEKE